MTKKSGFFDWEFIKPYDEQVTVLPNSRRILKPYSFFNLSDQSSCSLITILRFKLTRFFFPGNCCWALYTKTKYRGKRFMVGNNVNGCPVGGPVKLKKLRRVGRGRRRIRSIERYDGCNFIPRMI